MGWSTDWLYDLLLNRARLAWTEVRRAAEQWDEPCPDYLVATEHSDWDRQYAMTFGEPVRIWSSRDDFRSLCDDAALVPGRGPIDTTKSLFRVPTIQWYLSPDRKQVLICRHLGPRYGNGNWWNVLGQGARSKLEPSDRNGWIA
jgi:hypothetical protein